MRLDPILDWNHGRLLDREIAVLDLAAGLVLAIFLTQCVQMFNVLAGRGLSRYRGEC